MEAPPQAFRLFGPEHIVLIVLIPVIASILALVARRYRKTADILRIGFGIFLIINELAWYTHLILTGVFQFPGVLPLHLCDITVWVTAIVCLTKNVRAYEFAYYAGIVGSGMAVLTPDLWSPLLSYNTIRFFLSHGGAIAGVLFLLWGNFVYPEKGSVWRAFLLVNIFAAIVGVFNYFYGTNYMYLVQKPYGKSLLDYMGEWPWYILTGEVLLLVFFALLWLPVRRYSMQTAD